MSSNSQNDIDEQFLDRWLSEQNLPTDVPLQMKILAFAGHISLQLTKTKKPRGRPKKRIFGLCETRRYFSISRTDVT